LRTLLVIGGEGRMTGMSADHYPDDMKGLLLGLRNCAPYRQIVLYPTERFLLPPDDLEELVPLTEFDEALQVEARQDPDVLKNQATRQALSLLVESLLSFVGGREVVLICGRGNERSKSVFPFAASAKDERLDRQRVEKDRQPLLAGIKDWGIVFERFTSPCSPCQLLPSAEFFMKVPWGTQILSTDLLRRLRHILNAECPVTFPAEDVLGYPRALRVEGKRGGFLLAIPRPSNMCTFSKDLRAGKGFMKTIELVTTTGEPARKVSKVERSWMTREEVAVMLQRSKDTVDDLRAAGTLVDEPKAGRQVRITKESVQCYLDGKKG